MGRPEKVRKVRPLLYAAHSSLLFQWPDTGIWATKMGKMGRAVPPERPAILWYVYFPSSPLEWFPLSDRDIYGYRTTLLHGEWTITGVETRG